MGGCFRCCNVQWAIQVEVDSWISINSWYSWSASPLVVGFVFYGASIYPNTSNMCEWPITNWMQRLYFSRMESLFSGFPIWLRQSLRFKYVCCLIWITQNLGKQLAIRFGDLQQLWHRLRFSARMLDRKLLIQQIFGNWIGSNSALGWRYPFFLICLMVFSIHSAALTSVLYFLTPWELPRINCFQLLLISIAICVGEILMLLTFSWVKIPDEILQFWRDPHFEQFLWFFLWPKKTVSWWTRWTPPFSGLHGEAIAKTIRAAASTTNPWRKLAAALPGIPSRRWGRKQPLCQVYIFTYTLQTLYIYTRMYIYIHVYIYIYIICLFMYT